MWSLLKGGSPGRWRLLGKNLKDVLQGKAPRGKKRSPEWPNVRHEHLKSQPNCAVCGGNKKIEVHHLRPFHLAPELELDPNNLITLCESKRWGITCHQFVGHLGNYRLINTTCREDAFYLNGKLMEVRSEKLPVVRWAFIPVQPDDGWACSFGKCAAVADRYLVKVRPQVNGKFTHEESGCCSKHVDQIKRVHRLNPDLEEKPLHHRHALEGRRDE